MGDRLGTVDMCRKDGLLCHFRGRGAGSPSNTVWDGPRSTSVPSGTLIHPAIWPQQIWPKNWGFASLGRRGLSLHLTHCVQGRGLPACQVSSGSIQPFGHNTPTLQTDRQTGRTDNGLIAQGEPFHKRSPQKWLNRSTCPLSCGRRWAEEAQSKSYSPGGANVPSWDTHCCYLANAIEPSVCGGDAPYVKLL